MSWPGPEPHVDIGDLSDLVEGDLPDAGDLRDLVGGGHHEVFDRPGNHPRIRPILVALAARSAGARHVDPQVQHAAELVHLALAVHDLALGREGGRRRRVARRVLRRSVDWLGGNHLTLRALELARHASSPHVLGELIDTLREVTEAQALSRELQRGAVPDEQDWLEHADGYTGAVFSFCCRAGGGLAGADAATLSALGRYGRHVGRLWHVAEDVAGLRHGDGPAHLLRRALAGRPVLPVIRAGEVDPAIGECWSALVRTPRLGDAEKLALAVWSVGGVERARRRMATESWAARRAIGHLPDSVYRKAMERLAATLAKPV